MFNNVVISAATYVKAAAESIFFEPLTSLLLNKLNCSNCTKALDDALNSTGKVTSSNKRVINCTITPISKYPTIPNIKLQK